MFNAIAKPEIDPLEKERIGIERRRQRNLDRTKRILHAKTRVMGIDTEALDNQVRERQERERQEFERTQYYDNLQTQHGKQLSLLQAELETEQKRDAEELNFFRTEQAREKRLREQMEASAGDRFTEIPTNFLKFAGEDPDKAERTSYQKQQQQDWLAQQISDLANKEAAERAEDAAYARYSATLTDLQGKNEAYHDKMKTLARQELAEYNKQMAAGRKSELRRNEQQEQYKNDLEIENQLNSDFLNEARDATSYNFKGFSAEERQRILEEQKRQMEETQLQRLKNAQDEADYAKQHEEVRRTMIIQEREKQAQARQVELDLKYERAAQKSEKDLRENYLNKVVYTNPVKDDFFDQFGRDCR